MDDMVKEYNEEVDHLKKQYEEHSRAYQQGARKILVQKLKDYCRELFDEIQDNEKYSIIKYKLFPILQQWIIHNT